MGSYSSCFACGRTTPREVVQREYELQPNRRAMYAYIYPSNEWECVCSARWVRAELSETEAHDGALSVFTIANAGATEQCNPVWGDTYECHKCPAVWLARP